MAASFSGTHNDSHPWLSADTGQLFFMSLRPLSGAAESANLWVVDLDARHRGGEARALTGGLAPLSPSGPQ